MTAKEIKNLKKELLGKLHDVDDSYYGLSLENFILKN